MLAARRAGDRDLARVLKVRLRLGNPLEVPETGGLPHPVMLRILEKARGQGRDAVIFRDILDSPAEYRMADHVVVFDPERIDILEHQSLRDPVAKDPVMPSRPEEQSRRRFLLKPEVTGRRQSAKKPMFHGAEGSVPWIGRAKYRVQDGDPSCSI
ncbi:hypothetical protein [Cereibacter sphaeroides]|uniref:hypothetical protein n=1 Tax=Cereibacter sphaeroides TaxID=1063 RepID=UPI001F19CC4D|nr:hypothetical protein [Cereibacter sphaeroides]MCE6971932.1 hypothetical protein [Cereibacter sphaeroides]